MNYTIEKTDTHLFHFTEDSFPQITTIKEEFGIEDRLDIDFLVREAESDEPGTKTIHASFQFVGTPFWYDAFLAKIDREMSAEEAVIGFLEDCDDIDWYMAFYRTFADSMMPDPDEEADYPEEEYDELPPYRIGHAVPGFFYTFSIEKDSPDYPAILKDQPVHPEVTVVFHDQLESWQMDVWYGIRETRLRQFALRLEVKKGLASNEYALRAFGAALGHCDWSIYAEA